MIPIQSNTDLPTITSTTKSVTPVSAITAIAESQDSLPNFIEGNKYQALVEARLINNNSRVLVGDMPLQMKLPDNFQPGSKIELLLVTSKPELQFLITNQQESQNSTKNTISISQIGQFLNTLMQSLQNSEMTSKHSSHFTPALHINSNPILSSSNINSTELPALLQKAITESGLFYESHQSQWIEGKNTLENLKQEPQNKLLLLTPETMTNKNTSSPTPSTDMPVNNQIIPMVQQQLSTLETNHLFWRGEAWQGQIMEWDISEESANNKQKNEEPESVSQWRTQIKLSLPQLGNITATIALNAHDINIKLNASQSETLNLLHENQIPLTADLQSAGLRIKTFDIQYDANE